jgi:hypothetical protein
MFRIAVLLFSTGCAPVCEGLYVDADGDGYGDPASPAVECSKNADNAIADDRDCDDSDDGIYPGSDEIYYDGVDQDCNGLDDEWDQDSDGYTVSTAPEPSTHFDCDDTDPTIHPDSVQNADGSIDAPADFGPIDDPWTLDEGPELRLSPSQPNVQHHPSIALGGDGTFLLAWQMSFQESAEVFTQRFDLDGNPLGDVVQLNDLADTGGKPDIESDGDGYWATWQDNRGSIFVRKLSAEGIPIGPSVIAYQSSYAAEGPDLALQPDGNLGVVWNVDDIPGETGRDYYRLFDRDLNPLTEPIVAAVTGRSVADAAPLQNGGLVLVGTNKNSPPAGLLSEVYGRIIGPDHCVTPFRVDQGATLNPSRPSVAASTDDLIVVTWRNKISRDAADGVFVRLFDANGRALTDQYALMATPNDGTRAVARALGSDLFFAWQATANEPYSDSVATTVDLQTWHATSAPTLLNVDTSGYHERPVIDVEEDGADRLMIAAWEAERPSGRVILGRLTRFTR